MRITEIGVWTEIFFVGTSISVLSLAYAFVTFATTLTEDGEVEEPKMSVKILLGPEYVQNIFSRSLIKNLSLE